MKLYRQAPSNVPTKTAALVLFTFSFANLGALGQTTNSSSNQTAPNTNPQIKGTAVDPSAGPQAPAGQTAPVTTPAPTSEPQSQSQDQNQSQSQSQDQNQGQDKDQLPSSPRRPLPLPSTPAGQQNQTQQQPPAGAATAEKGVTHGGVASRPAGTAIAPAKQRQVRSILIKTGAILAGAVAIGTIYGLHRSTSSYPPGSGH